MHDYWTFSSGRVHTLMTAPHSVLKSISISLLHVLARLHSGLLACKRFRPTCIQVSGCNHFGGTASSTRTEHLSSGIVIQHTEEHRLTLIGWEGAWSLKISDTKPLQSAEPSLNGVSQARSLAKVSKRHCAEALASYRSHSLTEAAMMLHC